MYNKNALIIAGIVTSIIGFTGGFFSMKLIMDRDSSLADNVLPADTSTLAANVENSVDAKSITDKPKEKDAVKVKQGAKNNCPTPSKDYDDESYLDVGQDVSLPDTSYIPDNLVALDKKLTLSYPTCMKEDARDAMTTMLNAAKADGYNIKVSSAFRDYDTQETILNRNIKNGNKNANIAVAKPGHSEHQLGMTADLTGQSIKYATASGKFATSVEASWLEKHASEYGFIESYPKGKEDITGYMYEPWHYRYVGIDNAKAIIESGQTINQYFKSLNDAKQNNTPTNP